LDISSACCSFPPRFCGRETSVAGPIAVALALVVTAALMQFEQSPRADLYLDSGAW
jgi:hypothetical protein